MSINAIEKLVGTLSGVRSYVRTYVHTSCTAFRWKAVETKVHKALIILLPDVLYIFRVFVAFTSVMAARIIIGFSFVCVLADGLWLKAGWVCKLSNQFSYSLTR